MTATVDIGTRIELVPMDGHFHDISVALYRQGDAGDVTFRVHSYSGLAGTPERLDDIGRTLATLGGLQRLPAPPPSLRLPCGAEHNLAVRRAFLEAVKRDPQADLQPPPPQVLDKKSGLSFAVEALGQGQYRVAPAGPTGALDADDLERRVEVLVNGLLKLGQLRRVEGPAGIAADCVAFECGHDHDALVQLLLQRAPNVRAAVREQEAMAARGMLSAPSAQKE